MGFNDGSIGFYGVSWCFMVFHGVLWGLMMVYGVELMVVFMVVLWDLPSGYVNSLLLKPWS